MTKEQNRKKAKRLQAAMKVYVRICKIFGAGKKVDKVEMYIETNYGLARVLCYGFGDKQAKPVLFDMHGGGFILGNADMDEEMNVEIGRSAGCRIVSIDYAKAPDFPFPCAVEQIYSVVEYFHDNAGDYGIDTAKMAIGGHSAGGNLATVTCMKAKATGKFRFVCQALDYPPLDIATNPYEKPTPKGCIPPRMAEIFNDCYVEADKAKDPYVSPVFAEREQLTELPPALVILAGRDSLHDEGQRYAEKLKDAGVPVECHEYANMKHGFTYRKSKERDHAVKKIIDYLIQRFGEQ